MIRNSGLATDTLGSSPRFERWVHLSRAVQEIEPFMMPVIQGLGRIDVELASADRRFLALSASDRTAFQVANPLELSDRVTQSYLWVLGAYEIIRALDQRCRAGTLRLPENQSAILSEAKHQFGRVRVPLAKYEPSKRHAETDSAIAFPTIHDQFGIAWKVAADTVMSREELADEFRKALEGLRNSA